MPPPLLGGGAGSPSNTVAWGEAHLHTKWRHYPSSRLATTDMGRKLGAEPLWGSCVPIQHDVAGPRPISVPSGILIHPAIWPQQTQVNNWGDSAPFWGGGAGSPSNTMWPGPRPICIPSFILIHPAIWPQQIWAKNWGLHPLLGDGSWVPI